MTARNGRSGWNVWVGIALLAGALALTLHLAFGRGAGGASETELDPELRSALEECGPKEGRAQQDCYQAVLSQRLRERGVAPAMAALDALYDRDPDVEAEAHVYAHHIGIEAYSLSGDVAETFAGCSDRYSSGCYHGVIQAYFDDRGVVDAASLNGLCEPYKGEGRSRWILFQCLHGLGHGLAMHHDHDLVHALESCDLLTDHWDRESCYGGAFMENVMAATTPHHPATVLAVSDDGTGEMARGGAEAGHDHADRAERAVGGLRPAPERDPSALYAPGSAFKALDREDPHYPCSIVEDRYLSACYLMQTSAMLHLNGGDLGAVAEECARAPATWRSVCFRSLGRDITAWARQDPDRVLDGCRRAPQGLYRRSCYFGAVKALVDWWSAPEPGFEFCRKVEGDEAKAACYEALGEEIAVLLAGRSEREALCAEAEEPFVAECRRGARLPAARPGATEGKAAS